MSNLQETPQNPSRHLPIGTILQGGKYKILEVLGQGGFGITYLAEHSVFGEVALKELFLNSGTIHCSRENTTQKKVIVHFESEQFESFKVRFLKEAKTLYNLSDVKGVVHVRDIFEENGTAYFSMDYVRGEKLSDYIEKRKPLPKRDSLNIVRSLSEIVVNIHKHNILHRDIKPDNVIIDDSGEVNLIDFGIAREQVGEEDETHTTFHSPRYSPPEQKSADSPMGDYSDVFSLGATAYYVFTGVPPQRLEDRMLQSYDSPIKHIPSLPAFISDTIDKSLEVVMNKRIQTAHEFLKALSVGIAIDEVSEEMPSSSDPPIPNEETTFIDTSGSGDKTMVDHPEVPDASTIIDEEPGGKGGASAQKKVHEDVTEIDSDSPITPSFLDNLRQHFKALSQHLQQSVSTPKRRLLFTLGLLLLMVVAFSLRSTPKSPTEPEPLVERIARFRVLENQDTSLQPLELIWVGVSSMDTVIELRPGNTFSWDVTHLWDSLHQDTLSILSEGFFSETRLLANLVGSAVEEIQLMAITLPGVEDFVDSLQKYDWIKGQGEKLLFTSADTTIDYNPAGAAKYQKEEGTWQIDRTRDSTFIRFEIADTTLRFFVPLPWEEQDSLALVQLGREPIYYAATQKEMPRKERILEGKVVDSNGKGIRNAKVEIASLNKSVLTDRRGRFSIDLTASWNKVQYRGYIITDQYHLDSKRRIRADIRKSNLVIKLTEKPKPEVPKQKPIVLTCSTIQGYWTDGQEVIYVKSCSSGNGWAVLNGKGGKWKRLDNNGEVYLNYLSHDGKIAEEFQIVNPQETSRAFLLKGNQRFSRTSKVEIFCRNIEGTWKYKRKGRGQEIEVKIQNCLATRNGEQQGVIFHNGRETKFRRSKIDDKSLHVVLSFESKEIDYNIEVRSAFIPGKVNLKISRKREKFADPLGRK